MDDGDLLPRRKVLTDWGISDSSERRNRKEGRDWPPHVLIGRKIYYRRESLAAWLRRRESDRAVSTTDPDLDHPEEGVATK